MKTRQQYLNGECSHREYYSQFVGESIIKLVENGIGIKTILASTDPHLNDIPLKKWDVLAEHFKYMHLKLKEAGDYLTLAGSVCILKEAAKQIRNNFS